MNPLLSEETTSPDRLARFCHLQHQGLHPRTTRSRILQSGSDWKLRGKWLCGSVAHY